ncbi:3-deoxy-7-phosphoheptulonate synthase [Micromonospora sp. NBC_01699]|uniref:3-deoxy-7-phosphoheptulonate synthase n=1 Tax=Micromonospora sp. NBC_01699 TaxID=2975984 RepID=UPI002E349500|nr:3-deoxy-7-phosphoheptulonate synthase [Micromonospora sp. NBC_01699]
MTELVAISHVDVPQSEVNTLVDEAVAAGYSVALHRAGRRFLVFARSAHGAVPGTEFFRAKSYISDVVLENSLHPLGDRVRHPQGSVVEVGGVRFGGGNTVIIAGPCSAETPELLLETAAQVREAGASMLRVGVFKPRTSPYAFQGLGAGAFEALREARSRYGLPIVSEIISVSELDGLLTAVDMLQVGARNMQNYPLLSALGTCDRPVLLKRGLAATVDEWLSAAEYLMAGGNERVVLCERGIRTYERTTRFTLDLGVVPVLKGRTHLPVIVDPSHGTGRVDLVHPMSRAAVAAGADGVIVEVHPRPAQALSDGFQSLDLPGFKQLMTELEPVAQAVGRPLHTYSDLQPV